MTQSLSSLDTFWTSGHLCLLALDTYGLEVFTPDGHEVIYNADLYWCTTVGVNGNVVFHLPRLSVCPYS